MEEPVVETSLDAIITIDGEGRVVRFNRAAERMFGYSRVEALGQSLAELVIPVRLRAVHRERLSRLAQGDPPSVLDRAFQEHALRKSGEEFPVELVVTRTSDSPAMFTGFVRDLSQLVRAQEEAAHMKGLLTTAEHLAAMGSWELDLRSGEGLWSDGVYRIHGFERGAFSPAVKSYLPVVHNKDRGRVEQLLRRVVEAPEPLIGAELALDFRIVRPDGAVREVQARGRVEADEEGRPWRWVGMAQDVTEQRLTERDLQAHYALTQALRDWESFEEGVVGLLRRLGTALEAPVGSLWTLVDGGRLSCRAVWTAPGIRVSEFEAATRERSYAHGEGLPGRTWELGAPIIVEDLVADAAFERRKVAARSGLRSGVAFPAIGEAGPLAVLDFFTFDRRAPSERLARTLDGIGRDLGRFLEHRRADLDVRHLSPRELEVLKLAAAGNTGPRIAEQLFVGPATVKTHFEHIYEKLGVSDRAAAVAQALRMGLIP
jgi:PAS domain S-box-containing protein